MKFLVWALENFFVGSFFYAETKKLFNKFFYAPCVWLFENFSVGSFYAETKKLINKFFYMRIFWQIFEQMFKMSIVSELIPSKEANSMKNSINFFGLCL